MANHVFRVGLVGAGYISEFHLRALKRIANAHVVGITDLDADKARSVAKRFAIPTVYPSLAAMAETGLDVVHVLTPPDSHTSVTLQALRLGCHVMLEKPATTAPEDCDAIADLARKTGKVVCVDHALLRDHFILKALSVVRSGTIGEVLGVDYLRAQGTPPYRGGPLPPQYREGGFPIRDLGIHALYLIKAFVGDIEDASAQFWSRGGDPNLMFDEWRALVHCRGGLGQVQLSWNIRPYQHLLTVHGTRGILRADLFGLSLSTRSVSRLPSHLGHTFSAMREGLSSAGQIPLNIARVLTGRIMRYHGLTRLVEEFYRNLADHRPTPVPIDGVRDVVDWTERLARHADAAKVRILAQQTSPLSAPVLVTGASGFIGGHLVRRLLQQHNRIRLLLRRPPGSEWRNNSNVEWLLGDLGDPEAVDRAVADCKIVYHLGAGVRGRPWDLDRGTVVGTQNMIDACLKHRVKCLVYISSMSVIHAAKKGDPVDEAWPLEPAADKRGRYTQTKLQAERLITDAVRERRLPAIILRPGLVFGPGSPLLSPSVGLRKGNRIIIFGRGHTLLPFVHVQDLVDAICAAAQQQNFRPGAIYHIVDPTPITQLQYARRYIQSTGSNVTVVRFPRLLLYTLALAGQMAFRLLRHPSPVSIYRFRSALASHRFDCRAALHDLGWRPRIGTEAGLSMLLQPPGATEKPEVGMPLAPAEGVAAG